MRVFVAWDFTDLSAQKLLEAVRELGDGLLPDGRELRWTIPGQREQEAAGPIGSRLVAQNIAAADLVLALVDRANANVGWEIGLALGYGKQLRLAALGSAPAFRRGALAGHLVTRVATWQDLCSVVAQQDWAFTVSGPQRTEGIVSVLCPSGPEGAGLRDALRRERIEGVELVEPLSEKVEHAPALLARVRRLIWVVTLHAQEGSRDGDENVSNAVIAGMAHAAGWKVTVLQSKAARSLVDVAADSLEFDGIRDFVKHVRHSALTPLPEVASPRPGPAALRLAVTDLNHLDHHRLLGELARVFAERVTIEQLAASVGVDKLPASRAPDKLWGSVLRALTKKGGEIGALVQAGLDSEPDNTLFNELRDRAVRPSV